MSKVEKKDVKSPKGKKEDSKRKIIDESETGRTTPKTERHTSKQKNILQMPVDHSNLINEKFYNIALSLDSDQIYVHKYIIEARCKELLEAAQTKKQKKGLVTYEMKDIEFTVMNHIIKYLYSDKLDQIEPQECVKVIRSAHQLGLERLAQLAEVMLQQSLTIENLFELLKLSHDLNSDRAKKICLEFSVMNHSKFIADSRVRDIPIALFQEEAVLHEELKGKIADGWKPDAIECNQPSTINDDFKKLLETQEGTDAVLVIAKETIKFHRAIVAHASPKLMSLMEQKDPITMPKEFKHVGQDTFKALLRYIYYRGCDFTPLLATKLISFARQLDMEELADICEAKIRSGIDKSTVLDVLEVSYNPILKDKEEFQKELRKNCREFFLENIKDIDLTPLRNMDSVIGTELLVYVQKRIKSNYIISTESDKDEAYQSSTTLDQSEKSVEDKNTTEDAQVSDVRSEDKTESSEVKETETEKETDEEPATEEAATEEPEQVKSGEEADKSDSSSAEEQSANVVSEPVDPKKDKKSKKDEKAEKKDKKAEKKEKKKEKKEKKEKEKKEKEKKDKKDKSASKKKK